MKHPAITSVGASLLVAVLIGLNFLCPTTVFAALAQPPIDTLVLCAPPLRQSLQPWIDYRQQQDHRILVLPSAPRAAQNRAVIQQVVRRFPSIEHVVLVGDAGDWRMPKKSLLPADHVLAKVNVNFGSEFDIATDNTYADFNGDSIPDVAIGRIAATTPQDLTNYIDRVIKYESNNDNPQWRRRVNLIAGIGGFGQVTDTLIENTTRQIITDKIPGQYKTSMTHGSWRSPYCPDPRSFSDTAVERFNEGCMFWVYIGHGERTRLDTLRVPKQQFPILDEQSVKGMNCRNGNPIAIFLACYTGAFDSSRDCLAERMMKQPAGPIAVISGSRVTMPYAMGLLSLEMTDEFFNGDSETIGTLLLRSKQKMATAKPHDSDSDLADGDRYRNMIDSMGMALSPLPGMLAEEKTEHLHLINLLGDPLLRLKRPGSIDLQKSEVVTDSSGKRRLIVDGNSPSAGTMKLELVYRRDRFRQRPKRRRKFDPADDVLASYQQQYEKAQNLVCSEKTFAVTAGNFHAELEVSTDVNGQCRVRAMLVGATDDKFSENHFALGSGDLEIARIAKKDLRKNAKQTASKPAVKVSR